jgi:23S rRNA pseudouridine2605 synthase
LIKAGRVKVNGVPITELGSKVDPATDEVCLDGRQLELAVAPVYLMLNKPAGYLTTMIDARGRLSVRALVPMEEYPSLFPVGRLDRDTTGLLLFMTDGTLAHRLLHPKYHVAKRYRALVAGACTEEDADRLRKGVVLSDGPTQPALVCIGETLPRPLTPRERTRPKGLATDLSSVETTVWCTIREGRKRQVRRMFAHLGHEVRTLEREAFGPLELGDLKPGAWRLLTAPEIEALRRAVE